MIYIDPEHLESEDRIVAISRITEVVGGGRRLRFAALAVIGDKNGHVGFGAGKTQETLEAICKTVEGARKSLTEVPMVGSVVPCEVIGTFSDGRILARSAVEGSGVTAGGPVRAVLELAGVVDTTSKPLGSNTLVDVVRVVAGDLKQLKHAEEVAELCGRSVEELIR